MDLFNRLLIIQYAYALISFAVLFFISAPYGRFHRNGWGPVIPARWAWMIMEFPAFLVILIIFLRSDSWHNPVSIIFIAIWEAHYIQRTFFYSFLLKNGLKPFPILLVIMAIIFNSINGYINGVFLFEMHTYTTSWFYSLNFLIGTALFVMGYIINKASDRILSSIKSENKGYQIPRKGLFRYISSPHYLGEIIEWTGWAVLTWSPAGLAFAVFTLANLAPRARSHHRWYKNTFPDYPKNRKALIPFIW